MDYLTLRRHNFLKNKNNRKITRSWAPRSLIFKLQKKFENSVISTWLGEFLNLENRRFEYVTFFSIVNIKKIVNLLLFDI